MDKYRYSVTIDKDVADRVKQIQEQLAGCSNLSSLTEKLLITWIQSMEERE
jgi:hypothetical protein